MITNTKSEKMSLLKCLMIYFCIQNIAAENTPMDVICPEER